MAQSGSVPGQLRLAMQESGGWACITPPPPIWLGFFSSLWEGSRQRMEVSLTTWPNGGDCERSFLHRCNACERSTIADGRCMHPLTIQSGPLTGLGSPPPPHKGGRWEAGRRVLCRGLASSHSTQGGPLGLPCWMGTTSDPVSYAPLESRCCSGGGEFKFKIVVCRLVFSFQARAPCPTGCSIRNFAFNTAERTSLSLLNYMLFACFSC